MSSLNMTVNVELVAWAWQREAGNDDKWLIWAVMLLDGRPPRWEGAPYQTDLSPRQYWTRPGNHVPSVMRYYPWFAEDDE